jgi:hypothetical protein
MLELKETPEGVTLKVKVKPKAKRSAILGVRGDALLVSVTAPPERGKANQAVVELLARALDVPKGTVTIVSGETHPEKVLKIQGVSASDVQVKLAL